jgi:hypothetical protein
MFELSKLHSFPEVARTLGVAAREDAGTPVMKKNAALVRTSHFEFPSPFVI